MIKNFNLSKEEIKKRLEIIEKKIKINKRKNSLIKFTLVIILPACIGGLIFGLTMTGDIRKAIKIFIFSVIIVAIMLLLTTFEKLIFYYRLRRLPFLLFLMTKVVVHTILITTIFIVFYYYNFGDLLIKREHTKILFVLLTITGFLGLIMNLIFIINRMIGQGVLMKYLLGKYHNPVEEERIFMFLDITSSTTIAEKIGHRKFHSLLNDFFFDITDPIVENEGEIYKYIGDEVIITWPMINGFRNNNCVRTFFEIKKTIEEKRESYIKKYGLIPKFKAGLHCGTIIIGEMGDIKSEIAYLGDVMNTTARIQAECNAHDADFLTSSDVIEKLEEPLFFGYIELGEIQLRGKISSTTLVRIDI